MEEVTRLISEGNSLIEENIPTTLQRLEGLEVDGLPEDFRSTIRFATSSHTPPATGTRVTCHLDLFGYFLTGDLFLRVYYFTGAGVLLSTENVQVYGGGRSSQLLAFIWRLSQTGPYDARTGRTTAGYLTPNLLTNNVTASTILTNVVSPLDRKFEPTLAPMVVLSPPVLTEYYKYRPVTRGANATDLGVPTNKDIPLGANVQTQIIAANFALQGYGVRGGRVTLSCSLSPGSTLAAANYTWSLTTTLVDGTPGPTFNVVKNLFFSAGVQTPVQVDFILDPNLIPSPIIAMSAVNPLINTSIALRSADAAADLITYEFSGIRTVSPYIVAEGVNSNVTLTSVLDLLVAEPMPPVARGTVTQRTPILSRRSIGQIRSLSSRMP